MGEPRFDAIVFDVGGVLVQHDNRLIYHALAARCRAGISARDVELRVVDRRIDTGTRPVDDLREELARDCGYSGRQYEFSADWCCHFSFDHAMIEFALALAATKRVLLFSNTNREHWDYLTTGPASGLGRFERYLSHELCLAKPDVEAYQRVAKLAGIVPSRSLFLDDREDNVEGARRAGFNAEIFSGEARLRDLLGTTTGPAQTT